MKHWFRLHFLALTRTLGNLFRHPVGSMLNLLVIGITAALPLALWVLITSLSSITAQVSVDPQLSIFIRTSASSEEVTALKSTLNADARWEKVEFVPKDIALKNLQANLGTNDLTAGLPENPLPDAFVLLAKDNDPLALEGLKKELASITIVEEVQLDSDWARRLARITDLGQVIFEVVAGLLALALVLITGNAIRMQILTRRDEIEVAKLIGATDSFIRRPFMHAAVVQGALGGGVAVLIVWGLVSYVNPAVIELAHSYGQSVSLLAPDWLTILVVCAATALLCVVGAVFAVARYLYQYR
ncbi:permease-like cell division protein FtsX [Deefgea tanakiae]|jgi:cell division transport system permease protein|uniref:Cell division protein FtsX n=1 Tax=Deefgea tanakiae TaxID=2865840 RepID=A0ABX8Z664_9NEIS|nr:permease-like cell division protein FtsX [Deefgea tanakiae]QZA77807.1 permease-like cell division protein FtsX [Deefgea tanakiae]